MPGRRRVPVTQEPVYVARSYAERVISRLQWRWYRRRFPTRLPSPFIQGAETIPPERLSYLWLYRLEAVTAYERKHPTDWKPS